MTFQVVVYEILQGDMSLALILVFRWLKEVENLPQGSNSFPPDKTVDKSIGENHGFLMYLTPSSPSKCSSCVQSVALCRRAVA